MKYTCFKGTHWFLPVIPRFYWNKKQFEWIINFDSSCDYYFDENGKYDINKAIGVSQYLNPRKNSIRFGWRFNTETELIEISCFKEINYTFEINVIKSVERNKDINLKAQLYKGLAILSVDDEMYITASNLYSKLLIRTNPYFGGTEVSPHKMKISIN